MPPPHPPSNSNSNSIFILLLDFDSTLTHADTLVHLAAIPSTLSNSLKNKIPPWSHFTNLYISALKTSPSLPQSPPSQNSPRTSPLHREISHLNSHRALERESVQRVEGAGFFRGVRRDDVVRAAREAVKRGDVRFRRGWGDVVGRVMMEGVEGEGEGAGEVGIVSVNWSREWVRGCVVAAAAAAVETEDGTESKKKGWNVQSLRVIANEIEGLDHFEGSTGGLGRYFGSEDEGGIWTSGDKLRVVKTLLSEQRPRRQGGGLSVYVGDSVTDLEALLEVDVGICMRDEEMGSGQRELKEYLERVAVGCWWVGEWEWEGRPEKDMGLWWARDFQEIYESPLMGGGRIGREG